MSTATIYVSMSLLKKYNFKRTHTKHTYKIWTECFVHTVFIKSFVCFKSPSLWRGDKQHATSFIWNALCVFISPSLLRGDIQHATSFINKTALQILLPHVKLAKRKKNNVLSSFLTDCTAENAPTSGRYLWRIRRTATSQSIKILPNSMS